MFKERWGGRGEGLGGGIFSLLFSSIVKRNVGVKNGVFALTAIRSGLFSAGSRLSLCFDTDGVALRATRVNNSHQLRCIFWRHHRMIASPEGPQYEVFVRLPASPHHCCSTCSVETSLGECGFRYKCTLSACGKI